MRTSSSISIISCSATSFVAFVRVDRLRAVVEAATLRPLPLPRVAGGGGGGDCSAETGSGLGVEKNNGRTERTVSHLSEVSRWKHGCEAVPTHEGAGT
jgi:hypothetical protein